MKKSAGNFYKKALEKANKRHELKYLVESFDNQRNRFFKNKITRFVCRCDCKYCMNGKRYQANKQILKANDEITEFLSDKLC